MQYNQLLTSLHSLTPIEQIRKALYEKTPVLYYPRLEQKRKSITLVHRLPKTILPSSRNWWTSFFLWAFFPG